MGDAGIEALASLVYAGRLDQVETFYLTENSSLTNDGIIALARAINSHGLPMLTYLDLTELDEHKVTVVGISGIAIAVINGCPKFRQFGLSPCFSNDNCWMLEGMLRAVGREKYDITVF